jgi:hypothetical protein
MEALRDLERTVSEDRTFDELEARFPPRRVP